MRAVMKRRADVAFDDTRDYDDDDEDIAPLGPRLATCAFPPAPNAGDLATALAEGGANVTWIVRCVRRSWTLSKTPASACK